MQNNKFLAAFVALLGTLFACGGPDRPHTKRSPQSHRPAVFLGLASASLLCLAYLCSTLAAKFGPLAGAVPLLVLLTLPMAFGAGASAKLGLTLTTSQVLLDVVGSFRKWFPALSMLGTEFRGSPLKLDQTYIAHIAGMPTASTFDRAQGGYKNGANSARGLLQDVPVLVNGHPTCPLLWMHLDQIKDSKNDYQEAISNAGYILAKGAADQGVFAKLTHRYFTLEVISAVADFDYDVVQALVTTGNDNGQLPTGRILFVNSAVANVLAVDPRMISKDYAGQQMDGNAYRQWRNVGGFALIQEYPDLSSNNGANLGAAITGVAATDVITSTAHGLATGDPFVFSAIAGGAGLVISTRYFAIRIDADTFKLAATRALAVAGTALNFTTDITSGTGKITENLIAFSADKRAVAFLAGLPDGMQADICEVLGIPRTMVFETIQDPASKMSMAAAKWQEGGTGDAYFVPTFVYGTNAGKQGAATTSLAAAANAAGTGLDYAGIRVTTGA